MPVSLATTSPLTVATALLGELRRRRIIVPGPSASSNASSPLHLRRRNGTWRDQLTGCLTCGAIQRLWRRCWLPNRTRRRACWPGPACRRGRRDTRRSSASPISWPRLCAIGLDPTSADRRFHAKRAAQAGARGRPFPPPSTCACYLRCVAVPRWLPRCWTRSCA